MYRLFLFFIIYSFIGWLIESVYVSAEQRKIINRGFLNGPICPIYGVGAIIIIACLTPFYNNVILIFFIGTALASALEYIVGYLLEKLFHAKWWDYSSHRFNINGRVSLTNSLYWGALSVILIKFIHPNIINVVSTLPVRLSIVTSWVVFIIVIADITVTIPTVISLNNRLATVHHLYEDLHERMNIVPSIQEKIQDLHIKYNQVVSKQNILHRRIIFAFPTLRSVKFDRALSQLKNKINIKSK